LDALSGTTIDGNVVTNGYLTNGQLSASYMVGSNFRMNTVVDLVKKSLPVTTPCGLIDPNPETTMYQGILRDGWVGESFGIS